jgi:hypothetical protein
MSGERNYRGARCKSAAMTRCQASIANKVNPPRRTNSAAGRQVAEAGMAHRCHTAERPQAQLPIRPPNADRDAIESAHIIARFSFTLEVTLLEVPAWQYQQTKERVGSQTGTGKMLPFSFRRDG